MQNCKKCHQHVQDPFHGLHHDCFIKWFNVRETDNFQSVFLLNDRDHTHQRNMHNTSFFQGKFKKYEATLMGFRYILKVQENQYSELPNVEYCSNKIAEYLKIKVSPFYLIHFLNKIDTFVTRNFMDHGKPANLVHIYHFLKKDDLYTVTELIDIISAKIGRIDAIQQFVWICLFDALIGNHDRHGRNIGFIQDKDGFKLSPFYDNPSYIGIADPNMLLADINPTGRIATSNSSEPSMKDYVLEFIHLGYKNHIQEFYTNLEKTNITEIIQSSFMSENRKEAFQRLISKRKAELQHALQN